jgi:hypothetical protein
VDLAYRSQNGEKPRRMKEGIELVGPWLDGWKTGEHHLRRYRTAGQKQKGGMGRGATFFTAIIRTSDLEKY